MSAACFCEKCDPPKAAEPEEWRPIFDGFYDVSNLGNVRRSKPGTSTFVGRPLKALISAGGYKQVQLQGNRVSRRAYVHHIVAEAFHGARPDGLVINHKDANKVNNAASNLEYVTWKENVQHSLRLGTRRHGPTKPPVPLKGLSRGERHWMRRMPERIYRGEQLSTKLTEDRVRQMRADREGGDKMRDIANRYGISLAQTCRIINGQRWGHVK